MQCTDFSVTVGRDGVNAIASYTRNELGEVARVDLENGTRAEYTYDTVNRLEELVNYAPNDAVISSYSYQRNNGGCPTRIAYHDGRHRDYHYDVLYQLTREEHTDAWENKLFRHDYGHDDTGNRISKQHDSDSGPAPTTTARLARVQRPT